MNRTITLVQRVQIASPCHAKWDDMTGDDRLRYCNSCKLNVYNLSEMSEADGERLIIENEGRLCARIYRRSDGTVLTKDCPVGLRAIRRRIVWAGSRAAAAVAFIVSAAAYAIAERPRSERDQQQAFITGRITIVPEYSLYERVSQSLRQWLAATPPAPQVIMGVIAGPPPSPPAPALITSDSVNLKPNAEFHAPPGGADSSLFEGRP